MMTPTPIGPVWKLSEQMLLLRISIASKDENWRIKDLFGPSPSDSVVCGHMAQLLSRVAVTLSALLAPRESYLVQKG